MATLFSRSGFKQEDIRFDFTNFSRFGKHPTIKTLKELYNKEVEILYEVGKFYILLENEDEGASPWVFKTHKNVTLKDAIPVFTPSYSQFIFGLKGKLCESDTPPNTSDYYVCSIEPCDLTTATPSIKFEGKVLPLESLKTFSMSYSNLELPINNNAVASIYAWMKAVPDYEGDE